MNMGRPIDLTGFKKPVTWISGSENELAKIKEWTLPNACQVYRTGGSNFDARQARCWQAS
jgi:hypothetical protein